MAKKILVFGNSGSGKSTYAKRVHKEAGLPHLDLDTLAWQPEMPPTRKPLAESWQAIEHFMAVHENWVIEGCYSDLLELVAPNSTELVFMNLPVQMCIANARARPWEPHKYPSKAAQDANLDMLIDWIAQYPHRSDTFSLASHEALFQRWQGDKRMITGNPDKGK